MKVLKFIMLLSENDKLFITKLICYIDLNGHKNFCNCCY